MTWLLKIEFETKKAMEKFLDATEFDAFINPSLHGVIDVEYEENRRKLSLALDIWCENSKIKTRVQYYCSDCGSFVSKETMNCKTCTEKNYLSSSS